MERSRTAYPKDPKLLKIHLRYHPPGMILDYVDAYGARKEKTLDLLDLNLGTNVVKLVTELLNSEPLFCTLKHRMKCTDAVERLIQVQFHDYSKRYLQFQVIKPHALPLTGAAFSKDGSKVATCCMGSACKVFNSQTGNEIATLVGHDDAVTSINFNSIGDQILTSSDDSTLRIWRLDTDMIVSCKNVLTTATSGKKNDKSSNHCDEARVLFCKFSPDNQMVISACDDKTACVHDLDTSALRYKFCPELKLQQDLNSVNLDSTGTLLLLSPHTTCAAALFDLRTGELYETLDSHDMEISKSIFDFGGQTIATSSWDSTVKLWDMRMLEDPVVTLCESDSEITDIEFDSRGKCLVGGSANGSIYVWDAANSGRGNFRFQRKLQKSPLTKVLFSPNGAVVMGCNDVGTICMYNAELGTCLQTLPDHSREIVGAAFSYDSKYLMTASKDKVVRIHKHTAAQ